MSNNEKDQLATLIIELDKIEYQLPPFPHNYFLLDIEKSPLSHQDEIWILAESDSKIIAFLRVFWNVKTNNLDLGILRGMFVVENYRRQGIGKQLISNLLNILPSQITKLSFWAIKKTPGQHFMENVLNESPAQTDIQMVSKIQDFNGVEIAQIAADLKSDVESRGFRLIYIEDANFANYVDIKKYVNFYESIFNDVPLDDLTREKETYTEEKFLEKYEKNKLKGYIYHSFVALKGEEVAAVTEIQINRLQSLIADQLMTGVDKQYRGNNLGLTLKYQMLEKLIQETEVEFLTTDNASSNEHMIKINDKLGYREWTIGYIYEKELESNKIIDRSQGH